MGGFLFIKLFKNDVRNSAFRNISKGTPSENHPPKPNALGQRIEGKNSQKQRGIFHFVGIFVGIGFLRRSVNLINTVLYKSDSIPIEATELAKMRFE